MSLKHFKIIFIFLSFFYITCYKWLAICSINTITYQLKFHRIRRIWTLKIIWYWLLIIILHFSNIEISYTIKLNPSHVISFHLAYYLTIFLYFSDQIILWTVLLRCTLSKVVVCRQTIFFVLKVTSTNKLMYKCSKKCILKYVLSWSVNNFCSILKLYCFIAINI